MCLPQSGGAGIPREVSRRRGWREECSRAASTAKGKRTRSGQTASSRGIRETAVRGRTREHSWFVHATRSQGFDQSRANEYDPRNQCQHRDWKVVPEGFRMMVEITRETREVVLKNEFVKELGVGQLHGEIPGKRDEKKQNDSGNP